MILAAMRTKRNLQKYLKLAVQFGAREARVISSRTIVTAPWVRMKCRFGCCVYGQRLTCPPHSPSPEETRLMLRDYQTAILVHAEAYRSVSRIVSKLEREIFLDGHYKAFAMGSGPCRLCETCNLKEGKCRHPEEARPAMEASGIDVFQTAHNNGFPITVVREEGCEQHYYGVVLVE
jgi:predicted metal-binding protein